jgi:hypothetical protein
MLPSYRELTRFEDLVKVFPSAEKYNRNEETDMGFVLAMVALEEKTFNFTELFGLDILFEITSDPKRAANIKRLYDFDNKSFIVLTGQHDVFLREALSQIIASRSWRLTRPIRFFAQLIRDPRTLLARLLG